MPKSQAMGAGRVHGLRSEVDRGIETRQIFYTALLEELAETGFENASVNSILRRAARSKGSFYHHFKGFEDLVSRWYREHTAESARVVHAQLAQGGELQQVVLDDLTRILEAPISRAAIGVVLEMRLLAPRHPFLAALLREDRDAKVTWASAALTNAERSGEAVLPADPKKLAEMLYDGFFGLYLAHHSQAASGDLTAGVRGYVRAFMSLLRAER